MEYTAMSRNKKSNLTDDIIRQGLLTAQGEHEHMSQYIATMQRLVELLTQGTRTSLEEACANIARIIIEETDFESCSVFLWNERENRLMLAAAYALEDLLGVQAPRDSSSAVSSFAFVEGIAAQTFKAEAPVFIEDFREEAVLPTRDAANRLVSLASLPMLHFGVLNIGMCHPHAFSPQLRRNWELLGRTIGSFLHGFPSKESKTEECPVMETSSENRESSGSSHLSSDALLSQTPQGIALLDASLRVTKINKTLERFLGAVSAEIEGRSPAVLFRDAQVFSDLLSAISGSDQVELRDAHLVDSGGAICIADVFLSRLTGPEGQALGYIFLVNDMTKRMSLIKKDLQREKLVALGTMAGGVAHDFNNLLMAILGNIQLILPRTTDEESVRRLQSMEKAVHDGANTVRRLQRLTARDREIDLIHEVTDVSEAIKDTVELTRPRWKDAAEKHGHKVDLDLDLEPKCMASIQASDLREILMNMIFNALDAMPLGGAITIRSQRLEDQVMIEVADTGIGMSEGVMKRVFDPFYTTKGVENSGLGLSVCWGLVARSNGELQVKSKPGKGSVFMIRLPKAQERAKEESASNQEENGFSRKILLVEDSEEILGIFRDMLRLKGHKVAAVSRGEDALELLESERFDLVLTDLGMPGVSGWEVAGKAKLKNAKAPVILITGWGDHVDEKELQKVGIDMVLSKPLNWDMLLQAIEESLGSK